MKILVDMNLSPRWIGFLTDAGYEAVHWAAVGRPSAPDREILEYGAQHECIVLTHDLDFSAILAATHGEKPSVVQIRAGDVSPEAIGARVAAAVRQLAPELAIGALLTIDAKRNRLRLLPLRPSAK